MRIPTTCSMAGLLMAAGLNVQAATTLETEPVPLCLTEVATGLAQPWAVAFLPDGRFLVTERGGSLQLVTPQGDTRRITGTPEVSTRGQGGLLDIALHPEFGQPGGDNDWLYLTWSQAGDGGSATTLSRARLDGAQLSDLDTLFTQNRFSAAGRHYGSRLAWRQDGTLLMSIGDRGLDPQRAQDGSDHAGSILRLTADGRAPDDNPFVDDDEIADEIFTLGNRNPQGLVVAENGTAWSTEHGPRTGDEFNQLMAGENYGWPRVTLGRDYATNQPIGLDSAPGMQDPVHVFEGRFAPSGLTQVTAEAFPAWQGDFLAGGLSSERLVRLSLDADGGTSSEVVLEGEIGRIRDVRQGPDGAIYLLNDSPNGSLFKLLPSGSEQQTTSPCMAKATATSTN